MLQDMEQALFKEDYVILENEPYLNAIAINETNSKLVCGGVSSLFVMNNAKCFCFQDIQHLPQKNDFITTVVFMSKPQENRFITGSFEGYIKIWRRDDRGNYYCKYSFQHKNSVNALVINKYNTLIFSGSSDNKIKLWKYISSRKWVFLKTLNFHQDSVLSLSLSNQETQLLSCSLDQAIILYKLGKQGWKKKQRILVERHAFSVCFIYENMFAFQQPQGDWGLVIFKRNKCDNQFTKYMQFNPQGSEDIYLSHSHPSPFPLVFNHSNSILVYKHENKIYIIKVQQGQEDGGDWKFVSQQIIKFKTWMIYGAVSDKYMITYEELSSHLVRRKLFMIK